VTSLCDAERSRGRAPAGRGVDLGAALEELQVVHRKEQALLLRAAARRAYASSSRGRLYVAGRGRIRRDEPPADPLGDRRRSWRASCREEIAAAEQDGAPVHPELRALSAMPIASWPSASALAALALELEPSHAGLLELARAHVADGRPRAAVEILHGVLAAQPHPRVRLELLEVLALAFESAGRAGESLTCYEAALAEPGSDWRVAVSMLCLALSRGDVARAETAMRRLRPLSLEAPRTLLRLRAAAARAAARTRRLRPSASRSPAAGTWERVHRLALEGRGAEAQVAQALLASS